MTTGSPGSAQAYFFNLAAVALTVFALSIAKPVLLPLALAIMFAFILSPIASYGQRLGLGRVVSTLVTVLAAFAATTLLAFVIAAQVIDLAAELPEHESEIAAKLERLRGSDGPFSRLAKMVEDLSRTQRGSGEAAPPLRVQLESEPSLAETLEPVILMLEPVATAALVIVLMVFVLLSRDDLRSRLLASLGQSRLIGTVRALEDSTDRVSRYLLMQLMVNAGLGAVFGAGLFVMGVPYAVLWAVLMTLFRFIPFVGTWVAVLLPLSLSFATAPDWQQPLMILGYFAVIDLLTANVVEPLLFGHHTGVSPIALLTAAAFWAWVWGPIGLLLSTPLTVCLAVIGQHFAPVRALGLLLGDQRALPSHVEYYQRVLADGGAAGQPVALEVAAAGVVNAADDVLLPALLMARRDRAAGALTMAEETQVRAAVVGTIRPLLETGGASPASARLHVIGIPAHDECEEVPLRLLAGLIEQGGGRMAVLSSRQLPMEMVRQVEAAHARAVVVSNLAPGGLPQMIYLCRQLRERCPGLLIVAARWGGVRRYDQLLVRLRKAGASYLTTSLAQTIAQLNAGVDVAGDTAEAAAAAPVAARGASAL